MYNKELVMLPIKKQPLKGEEIKEMENLQELKKEIENINITYDYENTYNQLYNTIIDYKNDTQTWDFEYIFENIIDNIARLESEVE